MQNYLEVSGKTSRTIQRKNLSLRLEDLILAKLKPGIEISLGQYTESKKYFIEVEIENIGFGKVVDFEGNPYLFDDKKKAQDFYNLTKKEISKKKKGNYEIQIVPDGLVIFLNR